MGPGRRRAGWATVRITVGVRVKEPVALAALSMHRRRDENRRIEVKMDDSDRYVKAV